MTSKLSGIFDVDFCFIRVHKTHAFTFSATRIDFITLIACDIHKRDFLIVSGFHLFIKKSVQILSRNEWAISSVTSGLPYLTVNSPFSRLCVLVSNIAITFSIEVSILSAKALPVVKSNSIKRDFFISVVFCIDKCLPPFCRQRTKKRATFSRNPLFYLVELAGVEPASEIPTSSALHA